MPHALTTCRACAQLARQLEQEKARVAELRGAVGAMQQKVDQVNNTRQILERNMSRLYDTAHEKVAACDATLLARAASRGSSVAQSQSSAPSEKDT